MSCGGKHWLECDAQILKAADAIVRRIQHARRLDYEGPPNPVFHEDMLFTKGPGRMLGVLLAVDSQGHLHVLKAFSGQIGDTWHITGWVGPIHTLTSSETLYQEFRQVTEVLSQKLQKFQLIQHYHQQKAPGKLHPPRLPWHSGPTNSSGFTRAATSTTGGSSMQFAKDQMQLLKHRRKALSHHLMQQIQHSYVTRDCSGSPVSLLETYLEYHDTVDPGGTSVTKAGAFRGFPAGTGDCCCPKLLHAAAEQGLVPLSMLEFWYGSAPGTATKAKAGRVIPKGGLSADSSRQHLQCYGMCEKCKAILGTMLCGVEEAQTRIVMWPVSVLNV